MPRLKPKYEAFCRYYVDFHIASEAAENAGYAAAGAAKQGYRLMHRPEIVARIAELRRDIAEQDCMSEHAMLAKLEAAHGQAVFDCNPLQAAQIVKMQAELRAAFAKIDAPAKADSAALKAAEQTRALVAQLARQLGVALPA